MIVTVYQQVFVQGDRTRVHVTITGESGEVIDRRFADYSAYPLAQVAALHQRSLLRVLQRSLSLDKITYDCNVMGRAEFTVEGDKYIKNLISHPRLGDADKVRLVWVEPAPTAEDDEG